jgi:hypothetical protein
LIDEEGLPCISHCRRQDLPVVDGQKAELGLEVLEKKKKEEEEE